MTKHKSFQHQNIDENLKYGLGYCLEKTWDKEKGKESGDISTDGWVHIPPSEFISDNLCNLHLFFYRALGKLSYDQIIFQF